MVKFWKDNGKYFNAFGIAPFFGVVNSKYVLSVKIFGFSFGYSKSQRRFFK